MAFYETINTSAKDDFFDDKFDFSRNYGETIGVFTSLCYYQVMHPTILLCGAIYYAAKYNIDKYQITNQYSKAPIQFGRRSRTTTLYLFWSMIIGQIGNVIYYGFIAHDLKVGLGMFAGLLGSLLVTGAYKFKDKLCCKRESTKIKQGGKKLEKRKKGKKKGKQKKKGSGTKGNLTADEADEPIYSPPKPDELAVGIELAGSSSAEYESPLDMISYDIDPECTNFDELELKRSTTSDIEIGGAPSSASPRKIPFMKHLRKNGNNAEESGAHVVDGTEGFIDGTVEMT